MEHISKLKYMNFGHVRELNKESMTTPKTEIILYHP